MPITLNEKYLSDFISADETARKLTSMRTLHDALFSSACKGNDFTGWINAAENQNEDEISDILDTAKKIRSSCDVFIVIGIGGSYLGAASALDFLKGQFYNILPKDTPDIYFVGNDISALRMTEILTLCKDRDICLNVISKSGTTIETAIAFRIFREFIEKKYGSAASNRIFCTTDRNRGTLKSLADDNQYTSFVIPDNVGGRYSMLTPVGLLPLAVAGIDVRKLLDGAKAAYRELSVFSERNPACRYAAIRAMLYEKGKNCEIFSFIEPSFRMLGEWLKQLFGESEGKDGKGIFPASVIYSTDLHSLGQYIQDGMRFVFETFVSAEGAPLLVVPESKTDDDGLGYLAGAELSDINRKMSKAAAAAHVAGGVPCIFIDSDKRDEFSLGYLIYFFFVSCSLSCLALDVNPFDQPGVEAYKKNMFALLGKPGYEKLREELSQM